MRTILFGIDTLYGQPERFDGRELVVQRITPTQEDILNKAEDKYEASVRKAEISPLLRGIGLLAAGAIPICAKVLQGMNRKHSWEYIWQERPWMFYILIGCIAVFLIVLLIAVIKPKIRSRSASFISADEHIDRVHAECAAMLEVPFDAEWFDALACFYVMRGDERVILKKGDVTYFNAKCRVFKEDGALCIADNAMKIAIPIDGITGIRRINKRTILAKWNKETKHNRGEYREYGITLTKQGEPILKYYYALEFTHNGEDYELYFPPYELPVIERLTGRRAAE